MFKKIDAWLKRWEHRTRAALNADHVTPRGRRRAMRDFYFLDHGILRPLWRNFDEVCPGVYRSSQPSPSGYAKMARMGIRSVLSLRGDSNFSHSMVTRDACAKEGMNLVFVEMSARSAVSAKVYADLFEAFRTIEKPFVMHCKSGADRAGLASALYLINVLEVPVAKAAEQLSLRYLHVKSSSTGICDHLLETYAARNERSPIGIEEWIATEYDPAALTASFAASRAPK